MQIFLAQILAGLETRPPTVQEKDGMERTVRALEGLTGDGTLERDDFKDPAFLREVRVTGADGKKVFREGFWRGLDRFLTEIRSGRRNVCVTERALDALGDRLADPQIRGDFARICQQRGSAPPSQPPVPPESPTPPFAPPSPEPAAPAESAPPVPVPPEPAPSSPPPAPEAAKPPEPAPPQSGTATPPTFKDWLASKGQPAPVAPAPAAPAPAPQAPAPAAAAAPAADPQAAAKAAAEAERQRQEAESTRLAAEQRRQAEAAAAAAAQAQGAGSPAAVSGIDISKVRTGPTVVISLKKKTIRGRTDELLPQSSSTAYIAVPPKRIYDFVLNLNNPLYNDSNGDGRGDESPIPDWIYSRMTTMTGDPKSPDGATFIHHFRMVTMVGGVSVKMEGWVQYHVYDLGDGSYDIEWEEADPGRLAAGFKLLKQNRGGWGLKAVVQNGQVVGCRVTYKIWTDPAITKKDSEGKDTFDWKTAKDAVEVMTRLKVPLLFSNMSRAVGAGRTYSSSLSCSEEVKKEGYCPER